MSFIQTIINWWNADFWETCGRFAVVLGAVVLAWMGYETLVASNHVQHCYIEEESTMSKSCISQYKVKGSVDWEGDPTLATVDSLEKAEELKRTLSDCK